MTFDDGRLDDDAVLTRFDLNLRYQAEAGGRVRREAGATAEALAAAAARLQTTRPRAIVAAGPDSRLLRAVLEPSCPVPFVAWPGPGLPGWAGSLDLVVVLAPDGQDVGTARAVAEAARRGCAVVLACPSDSTVARHAAGNDVFVLPTETGDQLATAVVMLALLDRIQLAPHCEPEEVAHALDEVAITCSPHRDLAVNPAKILASSLADTNPLFWGGTVLAARAARRVAESVRRATGRASIAADAEHLLPLLEAARPADIFADPFGDEGPQVRPALVLLDDGDDEVVTGIRDRLVQAAEARGVRVAHISVPVEGEVARYAALLGTGTYAADYLQIGRTD